MLRYTLDKLFGAGSIPNLKSTSPIDHYLSMKKWTGRSSELQFSALLSYASINHSKARTLSKTKNCELCGSDFECKGLLGCWCRSVDISREQLSELSKQTADCICPNCLAKVQT